MYMALLVLHFRRQIGNFFLRISKFLLMEIFQIIMEVHVHIVVHCIIFVIDQLTRLHMILKPFMLRRIKKDVEHEMAEKVFGRGHEGVVI